VKHQQQIEAEAADRNDQLDRLIDQKYLAFFRQQPYHDKDVTSKLMQSLLLDDDLKKVFNLNCSDIKTLIKSLPQTKPVGRCFFNET